MRAKPKYGESDEKKRALLPKSYTEGKNTQPKYQLVTNKPVVTEERGRDQERYASREAVYRERSREYAREDTGV